jgi:hypothetical protein
MQVSTLKASALRGTKSGTNYTIWMELLEQDGFDFPPIEIIEQWDTSADKGE